LSVDDSGFRKSEDDGKHNDFEDIDGFEENDESSVLLAAVDTRVSTHAGILNAYGQKLTM
jgi:hypothetical protein